MRPYQFQAKLYNIWYKTWWSIPYIWYKTWWCTPWYQLLDSHPSVLLPADDLKTKVQYVFIPFCIYLFVKESHSILIYVVVWTYSSNYTSYFSLYFTWLAMIDCRRNLLLLWQLWLCLLNYSWDTLVKRFTVNNLHKSILHLFPWLTDVYMQLLFLDRNLKYCWVHFLHVCFILVLWKTKQKKKKTANASIVGIMLEVHNIMKLDNLSSKAT